MLLQYCSDLHLEFPENREFIKATPLLPRAKVLLLAGDIVPFASMARHNDFFDYLSANFSRTYWIPGNHEYYGSDAKNRSGTFEEPIRHNVLLTNNSTFEEGDTRLIFSTLWTTIGPLHQVDIEHGISDFQLIRYGAKKLRAAHVNQFHTESLAFIQAELARPTAKKTVVVTHHVPTYYHYPEVYKGSVYNEAFAVELFPLIHDSRAAYWIYGHNHFNIPDFHLGDTTLTTNQLGYVKNSEQRGFAPGKTIDV